MPQKFNPEDARLPELFQKKFQVNEETGCWEWTKRVDRDGYGAWSNGVFGTNRAHRVAYLALVGEIPKGLVIDHLCRVRHCVNPAHMEPVTQAENTRRGKNYIADNMKKTHCPQGHEYAGENLVFKKLKNGSTARLCRTCRNEQALERWRRVVRDPNAGPPNAEKTHCKNGHEYDEANTRYNTSKTGRVSRGCRACGRENYHRRKAKQKEVAA